MDSILLLILKFIPEILLFIGLYLIFNRIRLYRNLGKAIGETTSIKLKERDHGRHKAVEVAQEFHFQTETQDNYKFIPGFLGRFLSKSVGEKISIVYNKKNPRISFLDNIFFIWITPIIVTLLGLFLVLIKYALISKL